MHSGAAARIGLRSCVGPVRLSVGGIEARIDEFEVVSTAREATTIEDPQWRSSASPRCEHLFAALAGLSVYEGLAISIDGSELPLLDGGAATWCTAIAELGPTPTAPRLRALRA